MLNNSLVKNLIVLQKAFGYGSAKAYKIYAKLKAQDLLDKDSQSIINALTEAEAIKFKEVNDDFADKVIGDCRKENVKILTIESENFPARLLNIPAPPLVLFYRGNLPDIDNEPVFCIVGPRKVSKFGAKSAYSLSLRLSRAGFIIVSGGAV